MIWPMLGCRDLAKAAQCRLTINTSRTRRSSPRTTNTKLATPHKIPERDKVMLGFLAEKTGGQGELLDIGCSTGNLLLHIKRAFPKMKLAGGELAESSLTTARANPELAGVEFRTMDMLKITGTYDCITANAVTYLFEWPEYERAIQSIADALRPGGI